jgi:hypothetical protein
LALLISDTFKSRGTAQGVWMSEIKIYPAAQGGWMYVVVVAERAVVIGWCHSREQAERQAAVA